MQLAEDKQNWRFGHTHATSHLIVVTKHSVDDIGERPIMCLDMNGDVIVNM